MFYLRLFGTTAYAHVPLDLNLLKLYLRFVKVLLLGYFGHNSYKLLEKNTSSVFKSHDVVMLYNSLGEISGIFHCNNQNNQLKRRV